MLPNHIFVDVLQAYECFIRSAPGGENIFLKTWFLHLPQQPGTNPMNSCCLVNTITSVFQLATKPLKRKETDLFVFLSHLALSSKHSTGWTPNVTHVVVIQFLNSKCDWIGPRPGFPSIWWMRFLAKNNNQILDTLGAFALNRKKTGQFIALF